MLDVENVIEKAYMKNKCAGSEDGLNDSETDEMEPLREKGVCISCQHNIYMKNKGAGSEDGLIESETDEMEHTVFDDIGFTDNQLKQKKQMTRSSIMFRSWSVNSDIQKLAFDMQHPMITEVPSEMGGPMKSEKKAE